MTDSDSENKFDSVRKKISGGLNNFLDQFKTKYDISKSPFVAAAEHFHPQLSEWQDGDEWRLSMAAAYEGNMGWGDLDSLGLLFSKDNRALASFARSSSSSMGDQQFEMLVSTRRESFSYTLKDNTKVLIYYGNTPIGYLNENFTAFNMQNQLILQLDTMQMGKSSSSLFGSPYNSIGPAPFRFYTGLTGWFNIPPRKKMMSNSSVLIEGQAMAVAGNRMPEPYERMWMLAVYFFLRQGKFSYEQFVTTASEDFWDWVDLNILPY